MRRRGSRSQVTSHAEESEKNQNKRFPRGNSLFDTKAEKNQPTSRSNAKAEPLKGGEEPSTFCNEITYSGYF